MSKRCSGVTAHRMGQEREVRLGMELQKSPAAVGRWPRHAGESTLALGKWVCSCFLPGRARWEGQETLLGRFTGLWPLPKGFSHATCCGLFPFLLAGWCGRSVFLLKQVCGYPWSSRAASPAQTLWVFFRLPPDFLSGSVYIDPSTPRSLGLENFQPVCIGAISELLPHHVFFSPPVTSLISSGWKMCSTYSCAWDFETAVGQDVWTASDFFF